MAGSVNKVILVGNLGKDPDVRRLNSGDQVVSFSVATSETWRDKTLGERKERTEWHNVVIFNENLGKVAEQYCKKGTKVYLEGQLQTRKWQDQSGADRYTTEVVLQRFRGELQLLDSRGGGGEGRDSFPEEGAPRSSGFNRAATSERRPALSGGGGGAGRGRSTTTSRSERLPFLPLMLSLSKPELSGVEGAAGEALGAPSDVVRDPGHARVRRPFARRQCRGHGQTAHGRPQTAVREGRIPERAHLYRERQCRGRAAGGGD